MSEPTRLDGDLHVRGNLIVDGKGGLPEVTEADNGMVLGVDNGEWAPVAGGGGGGGGSVLVVPFSTLGIPKVDETETTEVTLGDLPYTSCYLYAGDFGDLGTVNAPKAIMLAFDDELSAVVELVPHYQWETYPAADPTKVNPGTLCNTAETQAILLTFYDEPWALIPANTALAEGTKEGGH